jgi:NAD(P)-dependent dehydrogenase (short-subunit alcohol dehydrogenase family)
MSVVLITGGSRGIGAATALACLANNAGHGLQNRIADGFDT